VHVESSTTMHKLVKKAKKEKMVKKNKEKIIEDLIHQKTPQPFNVTKWKLMDEKINGEYGTLFRLGNKPIMGVTHSQAL
jgi:hypothetical protein